MAVKNRVAWVVVMGLMLGACRAQPDPTMAPPSAFVDETAVPASSQEASPSAAASPSVKPIQVAENAEADALFTDPDTCTNPEAGYTVSYPDDWYTNTAIGEQPACTWFTPDFFEVDVPGQVPSEIWITIAMFDGRVGYTMLNVMESSAETLVGGFAGHRAEFWTLETVDDPESGRLAFHYVVPLDSAGPTLVAATSPDIADDYELSKAVLDRIMASLQFGSVAVPILPDEPTGPPISGEPVMAEDTDGTFRLTLETDQGRYRAGQEIEVVTTLTYLGPLAAIEARGSSNPGLIGFAVEREDPPIRISPAFTTDCGSHPMSRGTVVEVPFAKSGGYSPDEALAAFYAAYFDMEELRLPAGTWTISAGGGWSIGADCGDELHSLSASVTVVVEP